MHRHNLDQIAELAQGTLLDETTARHLVATCDICAAEFESQNAMISALGGVAPVAMTENEKAVMHRDIWTELTAPARSAVSKPPAWRSWAFGAAATVLVLVGAVGVFSNMGGSDSAETFSEIGSSLDGASGEQGPATPRFADTDGTDKQNDDEVVEGVSEGDGGSLDYLDTQFESIAADVHELTTADFYTESSTAGKCVFAAGLSSHRALVGFEEVTELILAIPDGADLSLAEITFVDPNTCSVVHVED